MLVLSSQPSSGTSFFLNPSSGSLFPSSRPGGSGVNGAEGSADADDADVPPPEELTLVATGTVLPDTFIGCACRSVLQTKDAGALATSIDFKCCSGG